MNALLVQTLLIVQIVKINFYLFQIVAEYAIIHV